MNKQTEALKMAMVIRAEVNGNDLHETNDGRVVVCAEDEDGTLYEIGHVTAELIAQDIQGARRAISRIKFGR